MMFTLPFLESAAGLMITVASARAAVVNTSHTQFFDRLLNSTVATFGFWLAVSSIPALLPVLVDTNIVIEAHTPGVLTIDVSATKVQSCEWIDTEAFVLSSGGQVLTRALLTPVGSTLGGSRPVGVNDFGSFHVIYPKHLSIRGVQLHSRHECGHRWPVDTDQGPFAIPALVSSASASPVWPGTPGNPLDTPIPAPPAFPIPQSYAPKLSDSPDKLKT